EIHIGIALQIEQARCPLLRSDLDAVIIARGKRKARADESGECKHDHHDFAKFLHTLPPYWILISTHTTTTFYKTQTILHKFSHYARLFAKCGAYYAKIICFYANMRRGRAQNAGFS